MKKTIKNGGKKLSKAQDGKIVNKPYNDSLNLYKEIGKPVQSFASRKTKTVSASPDKKYKTTVKEKMGPAGVSTKVKNKRTVKGFLSGAPKASMMKKGGPVKSKKK